MKECYAGRVLRLFVTCCPPHADNDGGRISSPGQMFHASRPTHRSKGLRKPVYRGIAFYVRVAFVNQMVAKPGRGGKPGVSGPQSSARYRTGDVCIPAQPSDSGIFGLKTTVVPVPEVAFGHAREHRPRDGYTRSRRHRIARAALCCRKDPARSQQHP